MSNTSITAVRPPKKETTYRVLLSFFPLIYKLASNLENTRCVFYLLFTNNTTEKTINYVYIEKHMMKVVITVLRLTYYLISLILSTSLNFVLNIQNIITKIVVFTFNQTKIQKKSVIIT